MINMHMKRAYFPALVAHNRTTARSATQWADAATFVRRASGFQRTAIDKRQPFSIRVRPRDFVRLAAGGKLSNILLKPEEISEGAGETPHKWLQGAKSKKLLLSLAAKQETASNQTVIK